MLMAVGLSRPGRERREVRHRAGAAAAFFTDSGVLSFNPFAMDSYYASFPSGHATTVGAVAAC